MTIESRCAHTCPENVRRRTWHRLLTTTVAAGALLLTGLAASIAAADDRPTPLQRLQSLAGSWTTGRVEFLDPDGSVRRTSAASAYNEFQLDGNVLVHRGRLVDPAIETRGWYYLSAADGRLHMGSVTTSGRYDEFIGGWHDGRLVMLSRSNDSTGERLFRMTHADITANSYVESLEVSLDGGQTWRMASRQTMQRVRPDAILDALQGYTGHWQSDEKTGRDGVRMRFEYDLQWLDAAETVLRMLITQVGAAGERSTLFEGYKGLDPDGTVYYRAASPSGRGAHGVVILEKDALVTAYEGWDAEGNTVQIRDVFEPVLDGQFTSRTYLRAPGDTAWRQIGEDSWSRHTGKD